MMMTIDNVGYSINTMKNERIYFEKADAIKLRSDGLSWWWLKSG